MDRRIFLSVIMDDHLQANNLKSLLLSLLLLLLFLLLLLYI